MAIPVITSSLPGRWEIIDSIMGLGVSKAGLFSSTLNSKSAFEECKKDLQSQAKALRGDAVISCIFEHRNFRDCIEIYGYGTVIKILTGV